MTHFTGPLRRIGLYANPVSGRGRGVPAAAQLRGILADAGHIVLDVTAQSAAEGRVRAYEAVRSGAIDALAVVGGDGTAHLGANACAGTDIPLVVVPAGTGNDNARSLGMPRKDIPAIARMISAGHTRRIDVGRCVTPDGERWWLGVLGGGFDTLVNTRGRTLKALHGTPRYLAAVALELPRFNGIPYAVQVDDQRRETQAMLVAVANGGAFGGGMKVCPDASMTDGLFDVMILHQIGRGEFLKIFPKVFSGGHVTHPAVEILRGRHVRLESDGIDSQADGEDFLPLPVDLETVPGALAVVAP